MEVDALRCGDHGRLGDHDVVRVRAAARGGEQDECDHRLADHQAVHTGAHLVDHACRVHARHEWRGRVRHSDGVAAGAEEDVGGVDRCRVDADSDFAGARLRFGEVEQAEFFRAAEAVHADGSHQRHNHG